jgi:hypothetical protein
MTQIPVRFASFITLFALIIAVPARAQGHQEEQQRNLIVEEIDAALEQGRWRVGPLRLAPRIRLGAGYDSNSFSSSTLPVSDTVFLFAPGVRGVVPVRNRALFEFFEELDFVYYRDLESLRDIYNVTRLGGTIGGKNLLFKAEGEFRKEKTRPTSELDVPLDQKHNRFDASLRFVLGWRQDMIFAYGNTRFRIEDPFLINGVPVHRLLDRDEDQYSLQLLRHLTAKTDLLFEGFYEVMDYQDDASGRDATAFGGVSGFQFSTRSNLYGQALLGYKRIVPKVETQADFSGLIGSVDLRSRLGRRFRVRGIYSRDAEPSVIDNNWFFIENRYGGFLDVYFAEKVFIRPGVVFGGNTYPRPSRFIDSEGRRALEPIDDRFQVYSFSFNIHLTTRLILRLGTSYMLRESNYPSFDKDRMLLNFGISTEIWPRPQSIRRGAWLSDYY